MAQRNAAWLLIVLAFCGCSSSGLLSDAEIQAQRHVAIADTLERASALKEATDEFLIVAERYPSTSVYALAVRKAALLLGFPSNPAANDSASLYWLNKYLTLTNSPEEKQFIQMYLRGVDRVSILHDSLERETATVDSLTAVTRKQGSEAVTRTRRLQELEAELQKVSTELRKLKEIDVGISKSREKNKP